MIVVLAGTVLASCDNRPKVPRLQLTGVDGSHVELDQNTPLTALYFFSVSNPVALGALYRMPDQLDEAADSIAIAMNVDRPPNVQHMQQQLLVPIVIDEANRIADAFGGIDLTPTLILIDKGQILLRQRATLDFDEINGLIEQHR